MNIQAQRLTTSGPLDAMDTYVDPDVKAGGTVLVCYKAAAGYTVMTFTVDSASFPTKTRTAGLADVDAATAFTDWQALQPA